MTIKDLGNPKPYTNEDMEDYIDRQVKYSINYCFISLLTGEKCLSQFDTMATDQFTRYGVCTQCFSLMSNEHKSKVMKMRSFKEYHKDRYGEFRHTRKLIENK